jgi:predicted ATP-dependent protease
VPADVREHMRFYPVSTVHEVLALALEAESLAKAA